MPLHLLFKKYQCCSLIYVTTALATASANLQGTALPICVYILPLLPQKM